MTPIKRISGDEVPEPVKIGFDRVYEWSDQFRRIPWLDGVMVQVTLAAGDNAFEHKLGRTPRGFIVIGFTGATSENYPSMVTADVRFMTLNSLDVMALTLWVWG